MSVNQSKTTMRKLRFPALLIVCAVIVSVFNNNAYARVENGKMAGTPVQATLNRYETGATACTKSDYSNMVHQVDLTVWFYYVKPGGAVYTRKEESQAVHEAATATHTVNVSISLPGKSAVTTQAISRHHIYAGHYTWGVTLVDGKRK